jgi:hypothetical protein
MAVEAVNKKAPNEFRLSRLNIFLFSLNQARRFSSYILKKKLHAIKNPRAKAKLVHSAFDTSLIVSYSRPFHKSNEPAGLPVSLREAVQTVLIDADEVALHRRVIEKRDRVFATRTLRLTKSKVSITMVQRFRSIKLRLSHSHAMKTGY